jgi:hypothetical protein
VHRNQETDKVSLPQHTGTRMTPEERLRALRLSYWKVNCNNENTWTGYTRIRSVGFFFLQNPSTSPEHHSLSVSESTQDLAWRPDWIPQLLLEINSILLLLFHPQLRYRRQTERIVQEWNLVLLLYEIWSQRAKWRHPQDDSEFRRGISTWSSPCRLAGEWKREEEVEAKGRRRRSSPLRPPEKR